MNIYYKTKYNKIGKIYFKGLDWNECCTYSDKANKVEIKSKLKIKSRMSELDLTVILGCQFVSYLGHSI